MPWRSKSYEVLPALSIRRSELRRSLRVVTVAWMFGTVWMCCMYGSHVKSFARMLGFNDLAFGIMAAIPWLAAFGQVFGAVMIERTGLRKYQFLYFMTIQRAMWLLLAAIPLILPIPSPAAVVTMLILLGISRTIAALGMPGWYTWMGDLIPRRIRGRYMAYRDRLAKVVQIGVVIAMGIALDAATVRDAPETAQRQPVLLIVVCGMLALAAVAGIIDILLFARIREVVPTLPDRPARPAVDIRVRRPSGRGPVAILAYAGRYTAAVVRQVLLDPLKDNAFRRYVLYAMAMTVAMSVGGWYFWLTAMEHLGFSKLGTNFLFMALGPVVGILSAKGWGKLIDRWGRRPVLVVATCGVILNVLFWFLATPYTPAPAFVASSVNWLSRHITGLFGHQMSLLGPDAPVGAFLLIAVNCAIGGVSWLGISLAQTGIMLGFSETRGRSKYVAASWALIGLAGALGGIVGGVVTQKLSFLREAPIGPFLWNNWHAAIALSLLARIAGLCLLVNMPDPGSGRVRDMVRVIGVNAYNTIAPRLFFRLRLSTWRRYGNGRG